MDVTYDYPDCPKMPAPAPAPERFGVSTNVCYGEGFPKDEECVSKVEKEITLARKYLSCYLLFVGVSY